MATEYNPRIVTDNLVLCLDAGNTKSYPILSSISMVASAYGDNPSSGPVQVTAPAGIQAGDLLIIMSSVPNASNIDSNIFGTGKFFKEKQDEKKEDIYSNIDEMLSSTLKNDDNS